MTMRFTQIKTHWRAEEASTVIEFLGDLRDMLWDVYGEEIIAMYKADAEIEIDDSQWDGEPDNEPF